MNAIDTRSSLRSRIVQSAIEQARPARDPDSTTVEDRFAGDDDLWAPEDWVPADWASEPWAAEAWAHVWHGDDDSGERYFAGLVVGLVFSAVVWLGLLAAALTALDLLS